VYEPCQDGFTSRLPQIFLATGKINDDDFKAIIAYGMDAKNIIPLAAKLKKITKWLCASDNKNLDRKSTTVVPPAAK
jgi:hypothetical protein